MEIRINNEAVEIREILLDKSSEEIGKQVRQYLDKDRTRFNFEVELSKDFTDQVLREIQAIPYGSTKTYGEIADNIDSSAIAVGQACGRNPVPVIIPCHRVASANGLGGYKYSSKLKKYLLDLESSE